VGAKVTYIDQSGRSRTGVVQELARADDVSHPQVWSTRFAADAYSFQGTLVAKIRTDGVTYSIP